MGTGAWVWATGGGESGAVAMDAALLTSSTNATGDASARITFRPSVRPKYWSFLPLSNKVAPTMYPADLPGIVIGTTSSRER